MMFFKRLFGRKERPAAERPHGVAPQQTQARQDATRAAMESELADARERRDAADERPESEQPPGQDSA